MESRMSETGVPRPAEPAAEGTSVPEELKPVAEASARAAVRFEALATELQQREARARQAELEARERELAALESAREAVAQAREMERRAAEAEARAASAALRAVVEGDMLAQPRTKRLAISPDGRSMALRRLEPASGALRASGTVRPLNGPPSSLRVPSLLTPIHSPRSFWYLAMNWRLQGVGMPMVVNRWVKGSMYQVPSLVVSSFGAKAWAGKAS